MLEKKKTKFKAISLKPHPSHIHAVNSALKREKKNKFYIQV